MRQTVQTRPLLEPVLVQVEQLVLTQARYRLKQCKQSSIVSAVKTHFKSLCSVLIQGLSRECDVVLVGQCPQIEVILGVDT